MSLFDGFRGVRLFHVPVDSFQVMGERAIQGKLAVRCWSNRPCPDVRHFVEFWPFFLNGRLVGAIELNGFREGINGVIGMICQCRCRNGQT